MKITLNGYELNITAKHEASPRANKEDLIYILNTISIWAQEAAELYEKMGAYGLNQSASDAGKELYKQLDAMGAYKNLKSDR